MKNTNKPHVTVKNTLVFRIGRKKVEMSEAEARELMTTLTVLFNYATLPKDLLGLITHEDQALKNHWPRIPSIPNDAFILNGGQQCMHDGLPPGVTGIACPCPKCTAICASPQPIAR